MEKFYPQRRKILKLIKTGILLLVGLPLLGKYLIPEKSFQGKVLEVSKDKLPGNGALVFREQKVGLVNINNEIMAFSLVCTHLGCTVNITDKDIICPCHGSRFSHRGQVRKGPAGQNLRRLDLLDKGSKIVIKR